jgi:8-oxo-dGTP pyrophosphatase MutT (NUDIX family)
MQIVVAGALITRGALLVAQRRRPPELAGLWELPGGKVAPGETEPPPTAASGWPAALAAGAAFPGSGVRYTTTGPRRPGYRKGVFARMRSPAAKRKLQGRPFPNRQITNDRSNP